MRVLIAGCGYVGVALGRELTLQGRDVWGLRRTRDSEALLTSAGIKPLFADVTKRDTLELLPAGYDWVISCASASGGGAEEYRRVYLEGSGNLLAWLKKTSPPQKFIYTSSTSVYGQSDGSLVDENSRTEPTTETARILLETEKLLLQAAQEEGFPAGILRVAGIYGPTRGYWLNQYLKVEAKIEGRGERFLNMVHRDDVVGAIIAALQHGRSGEIYNVCDEEPVTQLACFQWLTRKLGRGLPPFTPLDSRTARKRGASNKRVSNQKLKLELGYKFRFPTFREGYSAELDRQNAVS